MDFHFKLASKLAELLDSQFSIGTFRFGVGPLIGLIPGIGDVLQNGLSMYLIWIGIQMKIPTDKLAQMLVNVGFNFLMGIIPFIGDIGDFAFKSNMRNLAILKEHVAKTKNVIEGEIVS